MLCLMCTLVYSLVIDPTGNPRIRMSENRTLTRISRQKTEVVTQGYRKLEHE
jgi:hypothetical protein